MDDERRATKLLIEALSLLSDLDERYARIALDQPAPGSAAAEDDASNAKLAQSTRNLATTSLAVGLDNMHAARRLMIGEDSALRSDELSITLHPFAQFTLIRTCLEGATLTRWLCDQKADWAVRAARTVAAQLDDYQERSNTEKDLGAAGAPRRLGGKTADERKADLLNLRSALKIKAIGRMSATDLCEGYAVSQGPKLVGGRLAYRILSGLVHGKPWPILLISDHTPARDPSGNPLFRQVTANTTIATTFVSIAVHTLNAAVDDLEWYLTSTLPPTRS